MCNKLPSNIYLMSQNSNLHKMQEGQTAPPSTQSIFSYVKSYYVLHSKNELLWDKIGHIELNKH